MKKSKTKKMKSKEASSKDQPKNAAPEPEKPFDFGGIPDRDLKKNLGCG